MIRHHQGGLPMAQYAAAHATESAPSARLATTIVETQTAETQTLTAMLHRAGRHAAAGTLTAAVGSAGAGAGNVFPAPRTTSPRSSGDRALPSGGRGAGSNPAGGTLLSAGEHPALDRQRRPGDVAAGVADQEDQRGGELLGVARRGRPARGAICESR